MYLYWIPIAAFVVILGCNQGSRQAIENDGSLQPIADPISETAPDSLEDFIWPDTLIWYSRSGCFGTCPVYSFTVYEDQQASFSCRANCQPIGNTSILISDSRWQELSDMIRSADLPRFEGNHPTSEDAWVLDLPTSTLLYYSEAYGKTIIRNNHSAPSDYRRFELQFRNWIESILRDSRTAH